MREIKFRAWSEKHKQMYTGIGPFIDQSSGVSDHMPLMRYTGLKDKNGKEIYESDRVRWDGGEYVVA